RKKDMILVSGFNVYPNELEGVLSKHPKILECAVIGIDDEKSGQVPKAFIVKQDETLTQDEVMTYLKQQLTSYKLPKFIEFVSELPKSAVGKILRRELPRTVQP
ncbi:long-chain fatty acid--CoA ligase, partial [Yersinia pestis]